MLQKISPPYPVSTAFEKKAWINAANYNALYKKSVEDPDAFWKEQAAIIDWIKPFTKVKDVSFDLKDFRIRWFEDGILNASYNCLDRHLEKNGDKVAFIEEGDEPGNVRQVTYKELHESVCRLANALKSLGIQKGDCVTIYLPMTIEAAVAMLACARIGAVHSVVFGGFSPESLGSRIVDCQAKLVITADEGFRGGKTFPYKANCDEALRILGTECVKKVIVVKRAEGNPSWEDSRDVWYHELISTSSADCPPEPMAAEDPLFILYTSGSTAKPKGILHTTGGYMVYAALTHKYVFDYHPEDVYFCTADVGWITGHSYVVYGPLANAATSVIFEGIPTYPNPTRFWQIIDEHKVNIFYTAPTAIRSLMRFGEGPVKETSRKSLRLLGSVGEPINAQAWQWFYDIVGDNRCPIVDTWWQTETGGIMITPLPGATPLVPASATLPFFGVVPGIVDTEGRLLLDAAEGNLVLTTPWPGQARTILNDHERFLKTYYNAYPGYYFTGDGAKRDEQGYYWITGRVDDVMNVSGHRIGTAEVESAINRHPLVVESAVVGFPHEIKGQGIYAYITLRQGAQPSEDLIKEIKATVRQHISAIATPDAIQWARQLPKTRSGKVMRRILRKIAAGEHESLGDTSTLADADVVNDLLRGKISN